LVVNLVVLIITIVFANVNVIQKKEKNW